MPAAIQPFGVHSFVLRIPEIDTVGFFMSCTGLKLSVDVLEYREGGNNDVIHRLPTGLRYPNLVLSRGLTQEDVLLKWFAATLNEPQLKEITLTLKTAEAERTWTFTDAFPIDWTGPTIDSNGAGMCMETLEIAHGGLKVI
jgi:phage tail-like protein